MTVEITDNEGIILAELKGDFDLYSAPDTRNLLIRNMEGPGHRILVDLTGVHYLDSSGIGTLIRLIQHSREKKGTILFTGLQSSPRQVLAMSNILPLLTLADSRESGLKILNEKDNTHHG